MQNLHVGDSVRVAEQRPPDEPKTEMWIKLLVVLVALSAPFVGILYRRIRSRRLPEISDDEFLARFNDGWVAPPLEVLRLRKKIAAVLRVPAGKLAPDQSLAELSQRFGFLAEFRLGWSDLVDELGDVRKACGLPVDSEPPSTIGGFIEALAAGGISANERPRK